MDEGTGDVDDDDPSAIDEQFWEDQAKQQPDAGNEKQTEGKKDMEHENGELGASNEDRESKQRKEEKQEEGEEVADEDNAPEGNDSEIQNRQDDTLMPEAQPLDLGDDLDLNQPDGEKRKMSSLKMKWTF